MLPMHLNNALDDLALNVHLLRRIVLLLVSLRHLGTVDVLPHSFMADVEASLMVTLKQLIDDLPQKELLPSILFAIHLLDFL